MIAGLPGSSRMTPLLRRRLRGERGQSLVEMSFIAAIILVMAIGVVEVVTLYDHYISVVNASRDGARIGSKGSATDAEIRSLVATDMSRLPGAITPAADITISRAPVPGDSAISVKTCYDHHLLMHIPVVIPDIMRVCSSTTMRMVPTPGP